MPRQYVLDGTWVSPGFRCPHCDRVLAWGGMAMPVEEPKLTVPPNCILDKHRDVYEDRHVLVRRARSPHYGGDLLQRQAMLI